MRSRYVVRPVREEDFAAFLDLAVITGGELTNIPGDPDVVRTRIEESVHSFDPRVHKAGNHRYLFLLEDVERREVAGTCGIISKVGGFQPWYCYDLRPEKIAYPPLEVEHEVSVLSPNLNYNGPSEICCLFLRPENRRGGLGRLLSLSRFHFMAEFSRRFDRHVIAELRGITTEARESPFWENVTRHFFQMDFRRADYLSGLDDREFIAHLMPKHPLYVPLLPEAARQVIGRPHPDAEPAMKMLLQEGFRYAGQVDIFDAGPIVQAGIDGIRTIRARGKLPVARLTDEIPGRADFLLSNDRLDFRACIGKVDTIDEEGVVMERETAELLEVEEGDRVGFSPLRAPAEAGRGRAAEAEAETSSSGGERR